MSASNVDSRIEGFVTVRLGDACFGAPVLQVQDVVAEAPLNRVPQAPPEVAGVMNLRGRIVTAIDMRRRLGLPPQDVARARVSVVVEHGAELYALIVDDVGDVVWMSRADREAPPVTLSAHWRALIAGLHRMEDRLLLILDVEAVLTLSPQQAQAA
ncbi:MAG: chemotaxis protein CheW [Brevundimonas sp.]|nr:MAG: chemotaxis protein CheW [Brevundimonas sp.]